MIGKTVKDPEIRTRYRKIAEYIAAAKEAGEKLYSLWIENCDYDLALVPTTISIAFSLTGGMIPRLIPEFIRARPCPLITKKP